MILKWKLASIFVPIGTSKNIRRTTIESITYYNDTLEQRVPTGGLVDYYPTIRILTVGTFFTDYGGCVTIK